MQTSPPIKAATRPLRSPPKAAKALREPLLARGDQEAGAASGAQPPQPSDDTAYTAHLKAAMYGVINAVVCAPVMIGFAAIIFRHPAFHADPAVYPALVKLVLFSSMVHQAAFSGFSSLPFAIGQVQDAGLIFLSKMASDLADATADDSQQVRMATVLVALSLSTTLLGLAWPSAARALGGALARYVHNATCHKHNAPSNAQATTHKQDACAAPSTPCEDLRSPVPRATLVTNEA